MRKNLMMVVMVAVLSLSLTTAQAGLFDDVPEGHWAREAVEELVAKGIIEGHPDGTFKGQGSVTRYALAVTLARALATIDASAPDLAAPDLAALERLSVEFGDELSLLGVKVTALEDEIADAHDQIADIKSCSGEQKQCGGNTFGSVAVSGDAWIHYDNLDYVNDTTDDDQATFYQLAFNLSAHVNDDISTFVRVINDDLSGINFEGVEDTNFGIDLAYLDVKDLFDLADLRIGRQFVAVGHSIVLDDKVDALAFARAIDQVDVTLLLADLPDDGDNENGFSLNGLIADYAIENHSYNMYYLINRQVADVSPSYFGIAAEGHLFDKLGIFKNIDYSLEYGRIDPDTAGAIDGSFFLAEFRWDFTDDLAVTAMFGRGDEEYEPIGIYYWNRRNDMFGNLNIGTLPAGRTSASGSIQGIEDGLLKLDYEINEKITAIFIHEKVAVHDNSIIVPNAFDYKRKTLGIDYQMAPNTVLGVRYDQVAYDVEAVDTVADGGGWSRVRVDISVKF